MESIVEYVNGIIWSNALIFMCLGAGLWFTLRMGNHPHRQLQQAWNLHGADAFEWHQAHVLEHDPDLHDFEHERLLQDALAEVCRRTGATALR